jgi:putative endonuclease
MFKEKNYTKIMTGRKGETIAAAFLKNTGYQIVGTNYRCPLGEIDIIARDQDELVFIEVKTRKSTALGYPEQAVDVTKQKKMSRLALWYLEHNNMHDAKARFDVVAVTMSQSEPEIRLIKNAFDFIA